jgi:hypothetical protein
MTTNCSHSQDIASSGEIEAMLEEERLASGAMFDPRSNALLENPYLVLKKIREIDPVHWSPLLSSWLITRHQDAAELLRQANLSKNF